MSENTPMPSFSQIRQTLNFSPSYHAPTVTLTATSEFGRTAAALVAYVITNIVAKFECEMLSKREVMRPIEKLSFQPSIKLGYTANGLTLHRDRTLDSSSTTPAH